MCFYHNDDSDDDSDDDTVEGDEESDSGDSDDSDEESEEEEEEEDVEDEDEEEADEDEDENDEVFKDHDIDLFWRTGLMKSVWDNNTSASNTPGVSRQTSQQTSQQGASGLKQQGVVADSQGASYESFQEEEELMYKEEESLKQAQLELIAWMVESGISQENSEKYSPTLQTLNEIMLHGLELEVEVGSNARKYYKDPMEYITKLSKIWRSSSVKILMSKHGFNLQDSECILGSVPFSVELNAFEHHIEETTPRSRSHNETTTSRGKATDKSIVNSSTGAEVLLLHNNSSPDSPLTIREDEDEEDGDDESTHLQPSNDPKTIGLKVEELISQHKNSKPFIVTAPHYFKLPKKMSERGRRSFHNPHRLHSPSPPGSHLNDASLNNQGGTTVLSSGSDDVSELVVRNCRSCGCPDTAQLRLGPIGRLRAAKMIDSEVFPRNVIHVRARREMAKDIWLGQPYDPNAFKFNTVN